MAVLIVAAIGLVILGLLLFVPAPGPPVQPGQTPPEGSPAGAAGTNAPAGPEQRPATVYDTSANYRPLPALEALIGSQRRHAEFRVLSPDETVGRGKLIVFRWLCERTGPWKVTIMDNRGIALKEEEAKDPEYTLSSPKPGLYYWTVALEDEVLHVGRLSVR